jgi:hypothetical protein
MMSLSKLYVVGKGLDEFRYATKIVTIDILFNGLCLEPAWKTQNKFLLSKGQFLFFALDDDIAFHD